MPSTPRKRAPFASGLAPAGASAGEAAAPPAEARRYAPRGHGRYKMGTIARLSGFSPAVLRAWETRFEFLEPERTPKGHRLYTEDDLQVLQRVRALLDTGRSIGEVARLGRPALLGGAPEVLPKQQSFARAPEPAARAEAGGGVGGELARLKDEVVHAAIAVDAQRLQLALDQAFAAVPAPVAIRSVIGSAAHDIGELWLQGRCSIAGEHLASSLFSHRLRRLAHDAHAPHPGAPRAVCACFPDETHEVGALVVAYHLAQLGHQLVLLGPDLPFEDLWHACAVNRPRCVFLSVTRTPTYDAHRTQLLRYLARSSGERLTVIGGHGVPAEDAAVEKAGALLWPPHRSLEELAPALRAAQALD